MTGLLRLTAALWREESPGSVDEETTTINVTLLKRYGCAAFSSATTATMGPGESNITLPAPTLANLQASAAWTLTVDPVQSTGSFASAGTVAWSTPLTGTATQAGGCSTQWLQLNAAVATVRTNDGNRNDVIYYGLLPGVYQSRMSVAANRAA